MSEKRFTFGAVSPNVAMIKDNGQGLDIGEIVDLLNSLSEENEQLRQYADHNGELEFEIKQCRTKNKELQDKIDWLCEKYEYNGDSV